MWIVISLVLQFIIRLRFPINKSIATIISTRYGQPVVRLLRKFENADFKLRKAALDIEFIENCIKHELAPKFVQFKVANRGLRGSSAYKQCQRKLLVQELTVKKRNSKHLQTTLNQYTEQLKNCMRVIDFSHVSSKFLAKNNRTLNRIRLTHEKKLVNIGLRSAAETNDPEKVIFNFSSRQLTDTEKKLASERTQSLNPTQKTELCGFPHSI